MLYNARIYPPQLKIYSDYDILFCQ